MAKYAFLGYPVQPDGSVEIPEEAIVVGGNFIGATWQIMCLVPVTRQAAKPGGPEEESGAKKEEPDANVPPEP